MFRTRELACAEVSSRLLPWQWTLKLGVAFFGGLADLNPNTSHRLYGTCQRSLGAVTHSQPRRRTQILSPAPVAKENRGTGQK